MHNANEPGGNEADKKALRIFQSMLSETGKDNIWPGVAALHELGEVFRTSDGAYLVVGYDAAVEVLRRPDYFCKGNGIINPPLSAVSSEQLAELNEISSDSAPSIVAMDPPDHTRMRGLVQRSFMPRHVKAIESLIPIEIERLLDAIDPTEPIDIIGSFSRCLRR